MTSLSRPPRLRLAHLPTPLEHPERLASAMGVELWVKRDDATLGPEAGNKIRKLEFLLAEAIDRGDSTVITCGGIQSNHARATALLAARLGLRAVLYLRVSDLAEAPAIIAGNVLLDRLAGAEIRFITAEQYRDRERIMADAQAQLAAQGRSAYVIAEGGSSGLGAFGYVHAMEEVRAQLDAGEAGGRPFDVVVHACGSGGTAAGVALGCAAHGIAPQVLAMAVCDDSAYFEGVIARIIADARVIDPSLPEPVPVTVDDAAKGPAYAVSTPKHRARIAEAARLSGLVFDPVYSGKALSGLWDRAADGSLRNKRVLFIHTGGLPGLLAQAEIFSDVC